jgi:hypothetical protein
MQFFRIIKEAENLYRLARKLPPELMNGREVWDTLRQEFTNPFAARIHAHIIAMENKNGIVEEFAI